MGHFDQNLRVDTIISGKLRRYHHLAWWQQALKLRTIVIPNLVDGAKVAIGMIQSLVKLMVWRPDVVFTKGGFVCLPIGAAAHLLRIPLVIHDSDAHPGLTNRVLARWATSIGTGAPLKFYSYPAERAHYVGVPIMAEFTPYSSLKQRQAKLDLGFDELRPLIVITGGGLGARRLNDVVAQNLSALLEVTNVILISGELQYDELRSLTPQDDSRFQLHAFVSKGMANMLGAADIVIARAGATTILELAALAKPTILVPNGFLSGGHQLKNAAVYAEKGAVEVLDELSLTEHPELLVELVKDMIHDVARLEAMAHAFSEFARPNAAGDMADLVLSALNAPR